MKLISIDIKSDKQTVAEAIAQFLIELDACKKGGFKVMKVIHGYGSHGVGGAIRTELIKTLKQLKGKGTIQDYCLGTDLANAKTFKKIAINYCPDLLADRDMNFLNSGITFVII